MRHVLRHAAAIVAAASLARAAHGQTTPATVRVSVRHDSLAVAGALVRVVDGPAARTDARGAATLRPDAGERVLITSRLGYRPDTLRLALRAGLDTAVVVGLEEVGADVEAVVVT